MNSCILLMANMSGWRRSLPYSLRWQFSYFILHHSEQQHHHLRLQNSKIDNIMRNTRFMVANVRILKGIYTFFQIHFTVERT